MITHHAQKRLKERAGIKKDSAKKNTKAAFVEGVTHEETKGSLHRYIDYLYFYNQTATNMRIYNYFVYVFAGKSLITVLQLPTKYKKAYERVKAKRGAGGENDVERTNCAGEKRVHFPD